MEASAQPAGQFTLSDQMADLDRLVATVVTLRDDANHWFRIGNILRGKRSVAKLRESLEELDERASFISHVF